jgi:tetratricopeptide (TPR) repeat protein
MHWLERYVTCSADAAAPGTELLARVLLIWLAEKSRSITAHQAMRDIEALLPAVRDAGDQWILGIALARAGTMALSAENADKALAFYEESYRTRKHAGYSCTFANASSNLGFAAGFARDYARAQRHLEQAIRDAEAYDSVEAGLSAKSNLVHILFRQGQVNKVLTMAIASLKQLRRLGLRDLIIEQLAAITYAGAAKRVTRSTAVLYSTACKQMSHYHFDLWKSDRELFNAALATIQAGLSAAEAESAWAEGEVMTLDQAIDYAVDYAEGLLR